MSDYKHIFRRYARMACRAMIFSRRDPRSALLALRMTAWVMIISMLARVLPLSRVLELISPRQSRKLALQSSIPPVNVARLLDRLLKMNLWFLTPTCWKRAAILHRYLALSGIETRIVFGVRKEVARILTGHAWLETDGQPIFEVRPPDYIVTYCFPNEQ